MNKLLEKRQHVSHKVFRLQTQNLINLHVSSASCNTLNKKLNSGLLNDFNVI